MVGPLLLGAGERLELGGGDVRAACRRRGRERADGRAAFGLHLVSHRSPPAHGCVDSIARRAVDASRHGTAIVERAADLEVRDPERWRVHREASAADQRGRRGRRAAEVATASCRNQRRFRGCPAATAGEHGLSKRPRARRVAEASGASRSYRRTVSALSRVEVLRRVELDHAVREPSTPDQAIDSARSRGGIATGSSRPSVQRR